MPQDIELKHKTILLMGSAGFIGTNLAFRILQTVPSVKLVGINPSVEKLQSATGQMPRISFSEGI